MPSDYRPVPTVASPVIRVRAPARLHLGFLDLHGGLGRRFGSLGLTLDQPLTELLIRRAARHEARVHEARGPDGERALDYARRLAARLNLPGAVRIDIEQAIPAHAGLGSGTQLALAVGAGLARLHGLDLDATRIAALTGRGTRSGIGIGAFEQGGLLVDGGRGADTVVPPLLTRLPFPEDWRVLLIFDPQRAGFSGDHERSAFAELPEFPAERAARLCRLVLMQLLPALAERDAHGFGSALGELQAAIGEHFAPAQGGRYSSPAVAAALDGLRQQGLTGIGQSSWGPTGFALCADRVRGERLLRELRARGDRSLEFALCRARNLGAEIVGQERLSRPPDLPLHRVHP